ncbi:MFS transporter, YQGE family, putative transporter [Paenibacillus sophorae]|uniref:MFS transporter n=1 Tax=Paenibacillus sophorae TaxID=1333845 RepID=A0A1H8MBG1_9BACL|nr:MFS transporter [Paenibacillus sophorae]QWU17748.1 MFS transporter [Paenibacillus sophorae]SEO14695.1 MFS transporter, YQGE family, putative transporter [Paenibacillus sophorae]
MKVSLRGQAALLLAVNGLFVLSGALAGTFLNVYLWKSRQDYAMIGWFTVAQQLALGLSFWLGGKWVKEHNKMNALRLGIAVSGLFYLLVLWLESKVVQYVWPLGIVLGIASGLFWLAFNIVYFEITERENRDAFNGWVGLLGSLTGIVGPWLSGWLISALHGNRGYRLVFIISLCIYGAAAVLSFFLKKRKTSGSYEWLEPWHQLRSGDGDWRVTGTALFFQGLREGVFSFLIGLLVYIAAREESKLGQFTLITSAVSLVSYWAAGKWLRPKFRSAGMLCGALLLVAVIAPMLWAVNYGMLLVMGIGTSLFIPLYMLPMVSTSFDLMGESEESAGKRVELVVLRELCLMTGRLAGTFIFIGILSVSAAPRTVTLLLLGLGAAPLGSWLFLRRMLRRESLPERS